MRYENITRGVFIDRPNRFAAHMKFDENLLFFRSYIKLILPLSAPRSFSVISIYPAILLPKNILPLTVSLLMTDSKCRKIWGNFASGFGLRLLFVFSGLFY